MDNKRLFISLPVETTLSKKIYTRFKQLDLPWEKLKLSPPDQLHLTLKFLGDTPLDQLSPLIDTLSDIKLSPDYLELRINQTLIFNPHNPRVLSLSIADNPLLQRLYNQIDQALFDDGLAHKEVRRFSPHLTLARVKKAATADEFKKFTDLTLDYSFTVNSFELQESELTKFGPQYTVLQNFNL